MAPVVPFLGLIGAALGAAATVTTSVISSHQASKQAKDAQARLNEYYNQLKQQEASTQAEEKRITDETRQRNLAYLSTLNANNTGLQNMLSGGFDEDKMSGDYTLLGNTATSGVSSMFA